ncbi:dolichyl-diphosphooligosaccharide--protein glycosyltransferase subunit STT3 [Staphylococcus simulans]|uniref:dolichyl-diphosphooligosaccharide--protein glycosyltransferase subunit STT3 n=1 Tax=Staphylococcus simulans TaxID=1286 RepID=UPI0021D34A99|nr:dolichyl-diphosphooligosaccharide--protein glycosyltransferase subunit STT3 [Staphylococcus simulans]UXR35484.1 dolichyl-diphosphooligosaccharide--protein glycosyltransferase subunit STT3 [Staphylococcus simulans]
MNNNQNSIYEFNEQHKHKDKVDVLNQLSRIELLDLIVSYFSLKKERENLNSEYKTLRQKAYDNRNYLLNQLEEECNVKKDELYKDYSSKFITPLTDKIKNKAISRGFFFYLTFLIISLFVSFYLMNMHLNFLDKRTDNQPVITAYGIPIVYLNIILISLFIFASSIFRTKLVNLIWLFAPLLSVITPFFSFKYYHSELIHTKGFSFTFITLYYYFSSAIVTSIIATICLTIANYFIQFIFGNKEDVEEQKIRNIEEEAKANFKQKYPLDYFIDALGMREQYDLINQEFEAVDQNITSNYHSHSKIINYNLNTIENYFPTSFQDESSLLLLIDALQNGFATNWQQAIVWVRSENNHAELLSNLKHISSSIINLKDEIIAKQIEIREQNATQISLINEVNQNISEANTVLEGINQNIDKGFKKLEKSNRAIANKVDTVNIIQLLKK